MGHDADTDSCGGTVSAFQFESAQPKLACELKESVKLYQKLLWVDEVGWAKIRSQ